MTRYRFEVASPVNSADDFALRQIMAQTPMGGRVTLSFHREPSYFAANCVLGRDSQTIVCHDTEQGEIVGVGTRSVREMFVSGVPTRVGYLSGLRSIERVRNRSLLARGYRFLQKLHDADPRAPEFYLTTIAEGNSVAIDQLTSGRAGLPMYYPLSRLHTLAIPIRKLARNRKFESFDFEVTRADNFSEVIAYLHRMGAARTFFPLYRQTDFDPNNGTFRGVPASSIAVARRNNRIIGVAGIWDQRAFRQTIVNGYQRATSVVRPLINVWSRLTGGICLPKPGESFDACFVCFPMIEHSEPAVQSALLHQLGQWVPAGTRCLLAGFCDDDPLLPLVRKLAQTEYTTRLYAVSRAPLPAAIVAPQAKPYYLELGCL